MGSTFNAGLSYPSLHGKFVGRDSLEGMVDNRARQYTSSGLAESTQVESHQDWVLQRLNELTAARANIDAELRKFQDLYHELEYARAQQSVHLPFPIAATPSVPFTPTFPIFSPHSFSQPANLPPNQGEMWNIPNDMSPPATPRLPKYTVHNCAGKHIFLCECGHEASRERDMKRHRESIGHAKKSYICHCGRSYTRKDSLRRHEATHA